MFVTRAILRRRQTWQHDSGQLCESVLAKSLLIGGAGPADCNPECDRVSASDSFCFHQRDQ